MSAMPRRSEEYDYLFYDHHELWCSTFDEPFGCSGAGRLKSMIGLSHLYESCHSSILLPHLFMLDVMESLILVYI